MSVIGIKQRDPTGSTPLYTGRLRFQECRAYPAPSLVGLLSTLPPT